MCPPRWQPKVPDTSYAQWWAFLARWSDAIASWPNMADSSTGSFPKHAPSFCCSLDWNNQKLQPYPSSHILPLPAPSSAYVDTVRMVPVFASWEAMALCILDNMAAVILRFAVSTGSVWYPQYGLWSLNQSCYNLNHLG